MQSEVDRDSASWTAFFEVWWQKHGDQPMIAGELMAIAEDVLGEVVGNGSDRSRATRFGIALSRNRSRIFAGFRLQEVRTTDHQSRPRTAWGLVPAASETSSGSVAGLDVGAPAEIAHGKRPADPDVLVGVGGLE